jgi:hypothetical protein
MLGCVQTLHDMLWAIAAARLPIEEPAGPVMGFVTLAASIAHTKNDGPGPGVDL